MSTKFIFTSLLILASATGAFYYYQVLPCQTVIYYDVGDFDERFGISRDKFLNTTKEAEEIWERQTGQQLFSYQSNSKFKINLIFDERQATTIESNQTLQGIQGTRAYYDSLVTRYKTQAASYDAALKSYKQRVVEFENRLESYNRRVTEINSRGGATAQEYKELQAEQKYLDNEKSSLDRERITLNRQADELNALSDEINTLAKQLNIEVDVFNRRFGEAREFDQGQYTGYEINIYQFEGVNDLRLVLAHELGHALGIDHVENPESIMYYLMEEQDLKNPGLTAEDLNAFKKRCELNLLERIRTIFSQPVPHTGQSPY